jgi:hypothetical protein
MDELLARHSDLPIQQAEHNIDHFSWMLCQFSMVNRH